MSEMRGVVTRIESGLAHVEIGPRAAGCGRCHEEGGCGGSLLGGEETRVPRTYRLPNNIGAKVGDEVWLTIPEGSLLKVSLLAYLLPILLVIAGAALGSRESDAAAILGSLLGLAAGMGLLRVAQGKLLARREPLLSMRIKGCVFHSHEDTSIC